ncbi:YHS domain-containing protein [Nocardia farcinica]|uniref:YHS domain-containing protein n=2 Tax=Nocardia farcinica TaxID=37329 RepID=UPI001894D996|nr:YHS domain-containing protein [Nocardia farcinica]MBF6259321.1 YHS domain-containing protein [Nocardia farcinica]
MMTVELFLSPTVPATVDAELAERLLRTLTTEDGAPEQVLGKARELTHVVVHRPAAWATGDPGDRPRYLARVTAPGAWVNSPEFGAHIVSALTRTIAGTEPDPARLTREPHCVVQIVGLREHALGVLGAPVTSGEIVRMMTREFRDSGVTVEAPEGYAVDPVCGMTVEIASARIRLAHDGVEHYFCAPGCRKVFAEDLAPAD